MVSDTNLNKHFRDLLIAKFVAAGYFVMINVFTTDYKTCLARNEARSKPVPRDAMERMNAAYDAMDRTIDGFPGANLIQYINRD